MVTLSPYKQRNMPFTSPMFWYHQGQQPHRLPDARSDVKGRTLLRRIRSGYTVISPTRKTGSQSPQLEHQQHQQRQPLPVLLTEIEQPFEELQQRPPTPPDYEADDPPPYAQPLPPTLPGYTPIPGTVIDPARDLKEPYTAQRKRYRDVLKRRITSTKKLFSGDRTSFDGSDAGLVDDDESARGVVLYRENDHWVGTTDAQGEGLVEPRPRGFKGWVKRLWKRFMEFSDEHPYLFVLAVFFIVVVVICVLI